MQEPSATRAWQLSIAPPRGRPPFIAWTISVLAALVTASLPAPLVQAIENECILSNHYAIWDDTFGTDYGNAWEAPPINGNSPISSVFASETGFDCDLQNYAGDHLRFPAYILPNGDLHGSKLVDRGCGSFHAKVLFVGGIPDLIRNTVPFPTDDGGVLCLFQTAVGCGPNNPTCGGFWKQGLVYAVHWHSLSLTYDWEVPDNPLLLQYDTTLPFKVFLDNFVVKTHEHDVCWKESSLRLGC